VAMARAIANALADDKDLRINVKNRDLGKE